MPRPQGLTLSNNDGRPSETASLKESEESPLLGSSKNELGRSGVGHTTMNLMNTFIGAGLMSLPHAFASMGVFLSLIIILSISFLSYVSQHIVVRASHLSGLRTYTDLVHSEVGPVAGVLTQIIIVLNNFGILVVYLIILGDIFVGTESSQYDGVFPSLLGDHTGTKWYLSRWFVVFMISAIGIQPLILQKRMHNLAGSSTIAVIIATSFGVFVTILSIVAACQKTAQGLQLGVNQNIFEEPATRNCSFNIVLDGISIFLFAYVGCYNIPPLMEEMADYSMSKMSLALRLASGLTCILYGVVAVTTSATFGGSTHGDMLINLSPKSLNTFMSLQLAKALSYSLTIVYGVKLILIYPMENWCVRENISVLFRGSPRPSGALFYIFSYGITIAAYLTSLTVGSVYVLVGFIGSTASCILILIFPALLLWKMERRTMRVKFLVALLWLLSIILCFHGTGARGWLQYKKYPIYC